VLVPEFDRGYTINGDGTTNDLLPGTRVNQFGRGLDKIGVHAEELRESFERSTHRPNSGHGFRFIRLERAGLASEYVYITVKRGRTPSFVAYF